MKLGGTLGLILSFSSLISGIILLFRGEWRLVLGGFLFAIMAPYLLLTILMIPLMGAAKALEKLSTKGFGGFNALILIGSSLYQNGLILFYVYLVIVNVVDLNQYFSTTLFAFLVALGPLIYMAKEDEGAGTNMGILAALIGYVGLSILWFTENNTPVFVWSSLAAILVGVVTVHMFLVSKVLPKRLAK